jgi:hypothetical protein
MSTMHQAGNWDSHVEESSFCMVLPDFHPGFNTFVGSISQNRYFVVDILYFKRYLISSSLISLGQWTCSTLWLKRFLKSIIFLCFSHAMFHLFIQGIPRFLICWKTTGFWADYIHILEESDGQIYMWFPFCTCPMYHRVSFTCFIQPRCQHQNIIKHHETVKSGSGGLF